MKKAIKAHEQKNVEVKVDKKEGAMPAYLLDRENINRSKVKFQKFTIFTKILKHQYQGWMTENKSFTLSNPDIFNEIQYLKSYFNIKII